MRRRRLLAHAAGIAGAIHIPARAQSARVARVGFLIAGDAEPSWSLFRKAMTGLRHVEGRTVHYEFRSSDANRERLAAHAASLVEANVDVVAPAIEALARRGVDGVIVQPSLQIQEAGLPSVSYRRQFADAGGLFALGADQGELYRIVASYADRVLKGTATADLPVQKATRFELVVNQTTAKAIGLTFSPMFLARVDEVIE